MTALLLYLTLAYVFLAALLVLMLCYSRIHAMLKIALTIVVFGFYWMSYQGWQTSQGWPAHAELPGQFLLHYGMIEEPNSDDNTPGAIYIWATDLDNQTLGDLPRAYQLPYTRESHAGVEEALRQINNGKLQLGRNLRKPDPMVPEAVNDGLGDTRIELEFSKLPDPALPEK